MNDLFENHDNAISEIENKYYADIGAAQEAFYAANAKAWTDRRTALDEERQAFEDARESRLTLYYVGPPKLPKAEVPPEVAAKLEQAIAEAANANDEPVMQAAE